MSIEVKKITKTYGKQTALNNISFNINAGEIVGFLGPNGAGKSTMMKIITGYLPPDSGNVKVCNLDIKTNSLKSRSKIGYLPEHNPLYPEMYVKEYLNLVAGIYNLGKNTKKRISEVIEITGLNPEKNKKIISLSKGYRQRVGIAQALLPDPDVLILDEPTTGLDPNQILEVRDLIKKAGQKKTIMLSTHIMQEVQAICERVIIINKGNIVADAKTSELNTSINDKYQILCEFLNPINTVEIKNKFNISEIKNIEKNKYIIYTKNDIREKLFDYTIASKNKILTLNLKNNSIEDIFRSLTTNNISSKI